MNITEAMLQKALLKIASRMGTLLVQARRGDLNDFGMGEMAGMSYAAETLLEVIRQPQIKGKQHLAMAIDSDGRVREVK